MSSMKSATVVKSPNPNWVGLSINNNIQSIDIYNLDLSSVDVQIGKDPNNNHAFLNFYTKILNPTLYNGKKYYNLNLFEQFYCAANRGCTKNIDPFREKVLGRLTEYFNMEDVRKFTFKEYAELLSTKPLGTPVQIGFDLDFCKDKDLYKGLSMPENKSLEDLEKEMKTIGYYDITEYFKAPKPHQLGTHHCTNKSVCRNVNGYIIYLVPEDLFFKDFKSDYLQVKDKEVQLSLATCNKKAFPFQPTTYGKAVRSDESRMPVRLSGPSDFVGDAQKFIQAPLFGRNYLTTPTVHEGSMLEERKLFWCMVRAIEKYTTLEEAMQIKLWSSSWKTKEKDSKGNVIKNPITSFNVRLAPRNALYLKKASKMPDIKTKVSENDELKKFSEDQIKWIVKYHMNGQISPFLYLRYGETSFELCDIFEIPEEFTTKNGTVQRCKFDNASSLKENEDFEKYANKVELAPGIKTAAHCNLFAHRMVLIPIITMTFKDNSCSMRFAVSHMWATIMPEKDTANNDVEEDYSAYEEAATIEQLKTEEGLADVSEDEEEVDYDEDSFESS